MTKLVQFHQCRRNFSTAPKKATLMSYSVAPFRLQYLSDLHLEKTGTFPRLPVRAPYLALLGDIGDPTSPTYRDFLEYCSDRFRQVFVLMGNHECYDRSYVSATRAISDVCESRPNLIYLNRCLREVDGYLLLGATLWSEINPLTALHLRDFTRIHRSNGALITYEDYRRWHYLDRSWLERVIPNCHHPIIVLTHHLPSMSLIAKKYEAYPYNDAFATSLVHLIQDPVKAWLCGHSHGRVERWINQVYCGINAGPEASLSRTVTIY
jgi:hypothetical protein